MDPEAIAGLFTSLDSELWLVTAAAGNRRGGLIATCVKPASIVPALPRVLIGLARQHHTWELVEASGAFGLHLLGDEHLDLVWRFGLHSGRELDKLAEVSTQTGVTGCPLLTDALGRLECRVEARLDMGDRTLYVAEVLDGGMLREGSILTVNRMLRLAPPAKLHALKEALSQDGVVDAAAIEAWRGRLAASLGRARAPRSPEARG
jgi:flavin reductase (DIM6/NTAB) family NADH-FMN oxidoreductase RutF